MVLFHNDVLVDWTTAILRMVYILTSFILVLVKPLALLKKTANSQTSSLRFMGN